MPSPRAEVEVPTQPWDVFLPDFVSAWAPNANGQAEHVTIVGPTGQGKTHLAKAILLERAKVRSSHMVALGTKPRDRTLASFGWPVIREWPPGYGQDQVIYWPRFKPTLAETKADHRTRFVAVLEDIRKDGGRTVFVDEVAYLSNDLSMRKDLATYWQMARSTDVCLVAATQRPVEVPRQMWSECSWLFAFRTRDKAELDRLGEIGGGMDTGQVRAAIQGLAPHEFLCVRTRTGEMMVSKVTRTRKAAVAT